ncbi:MAG: AbrB family transcriptional regulator [Proteobacteria bacterium]|nr:AbrB family transcriptional regulator [Pseudomonadota bacterium]
MPPRLTTLVIASLGVGVFWALRLPLPFLFGPMFACLTAALFGVQMNTLGMVSKSARTILGVAVGASITPLFFSELLAVKYSVLLAALYTLAIAMLGVPFFRYVWRFDPPTAYFAAMPGGLQDMVVFGMEAGGDARALSLIQATRVLIIVVSMPILILHVFGASLSQPIGVAATSLPPHEIALMILAAAVGWQVARMLGLFGAAILGPMIAAAVLSLMGLLHNRPPTEAILFAQFFIGSGLGVYFSGITLGELRRVVVAGSSYALLLGGLAFGFSWLAASITGVSGLDAFLAFAPGGQAEMTILAIAVGADLSYVVTHHIVRLILVITGAPIMVRFLR